MDIKDRKKEIRRDVAALKKTLLPEQKTLLSHQILSKIESLGVFIQSSTVLLYHALPDEVQTAKFIDKWCDKKRIVLPVVVGDDLELREYNPLKICQGYQSISEPDGTPIVSPDQIELAIIPGVAFDRAKNRLGRGKGFYDRLLCGVKAPLIGLAYSIQIVETIPMESFDKPLDMVVTENDIFSESV